MLPPVPVPEPVPLELEPLPGLDVEPFASPLLLLPLSDLFLSEQPGSAIPRNPDKMIAVTNEISFPIIFLLSIAVSPLRFSFTTQWLCHGTDYEGFV